MYNKFTQEFINQCHCEALADESQKLMRHLLRCRRVSKPYKAGCP